MADTYAVIKERLAECAPFHGSSLSAQRSEGLYVVYSYATPIAWADVEQGKWGMDYRLHSRTTRKHQKMVYQIFTVRFG